MSPTIFTHTFDTPVYKGTSTINTGLFIDGKWVDAVDGARLDDINPANGKVTTSFSVGGAKDIDLAVVAARKAYRTVWGLKTPGAERGRLLSKLTDLLEKHADELAALDALDTGKSFGAAKSIDLPVAISSFRFYAGWAGKKHGDVIETNETKLCYTRPEPYGVVGIIVPWNFPLMMLSWKVPAALATGNTIVIKPSEETPLSTLRFAELVTEAGFPPGVINIVNGLGRTAGQAMSEHMGIDKISFTGSTFVGRKILEAASRTNLKDVTLELGGKSPNIIFDDADLEQAVKWAGHGVFLNQGQACTAGSRIFVQEGIYDKFMQAFQASAKALREATGDPFLATTQHGPQVSEVQFNRIMDFIDSGKKEGATLLEGGERHGTEGYFIAPTIFGDVTTDMKIMKEEIFGPVASVIKFKDEADVIEQANATIYGLASSVFTENLSRAIRIAQALESGTVWINAANFPDTSVPFGGFKASGSGRELGAEALATYTQTKAIHVNIGFRL